MTFEIFFNINKLYVYFKINIMIDFGILLHTLYVLLVQQYSKVCKHGSLVKQYSNAHLLYSNEQLVVISSQYLLN